MRLCVVVPGEDHLATAGVRIRYQRIAPHLEALGHSLTLIPITDIKPRPGQDADCYLISKCYDARGLLLASELRARGVPVGADFFDDYYSQANDSRFVHLRQWLRDMGKVITFTLCSTPLMRANLEQLLPGLPCHMMNDPFDRLDIEALGPQIEARLARVRETGIVDIGWFGIGDNPYFPVGVSDLDAFAPVLARLRAQGLTPRLSILTNQRALTLDRMSLLARLPVDWRLETWSETAERKLIAASYACFLPVNAQRFSIVKSLNRAVTALTGGAQVITAGYPLYDVFADFIYRGAEGFGEDIRQAHPKLRAATLPALERALDAHANPENEARSLAGFLVSLARPEAAASPPDYAVIHGRNAIAAVHKQVQRMGFLSVANPRANADLNYDLRVTHHPGTGEPSLQLSIHGQRRLTPGLAAQTSPHEVNGRVFHFLPLPEDYASLLPAAQPELTDADALFIAACQQEVTALARLVRQLFGDIDILVSEPASPFWRGDALELARSAA